MKPEPISNSRPNEVRATDGQLRDRCMLLWKEVYVATATAQIQARGYALDVHSTEAARMADDAVARFRKVFA